MSSKTLLSFFATGVLAISLTGCGIYHMPIQQGNIIHASSAKKIHKGMTRKQVIAKLGPPVLITPFKSNQVIYVYTLRPTSGKNLYKKLEITFSHSRVVSKHFTHN